MLLEVLKIGLIFLDYLYRFFGNLFSVDRTVVYETNEEFIGVCHHRDETSDDGC